MEQVISLTVFDDKHKIYLGEHRIQRVPSTEKKGRRHTSFVYITEIVEHSNKILISDRDIKVDTFRASGAGGQHRNKTDSGIRMTHIPTGIVATATEQRSQHQNRAVARERLLQKLLEHTSRSNEYINHDSRWNWCGWRNEVVLPNGQKKNMNLVLKTGI